MVLEFWVDLEECNYSVIEEFEFDYIGFEFILMELVVV